MYFKIAIFSFFLFHLACNPMQVNSPEQILQNYHAKRDKTNSRINFETLITKAECTTPDGKSYITEIHSRKDYYCYFQQIYDYKENFYALIKEDSSGSTIGFYEELEPLEEIDIYIIKSHEFHKISLFPTSYFHDFQLDGDTLIFDTPCWRLTAKDALQNKVELYFHQENHLWEGYKILNPQNLEESILIRHLTWNKSPWGLLIDKLSILQGETDTYLFDFDDVLFNLEDFRDRGPQ